MLQTVAGANNIIRQVNHIKLADIQHQEHGYFGLAGIGDVVNSFPKTFVGSSLLNLSNSSQKIQKFI